MSNRVLKFCSTIQRALGEILIKESEDPLLKFVSVSRVEASPDLKSVRVFVSSWNADKDKVLAELENARSFLLHKLARRIYCKFLPQIQFHYDQGFDFNDKLKSLNETGNEPARPPRRTGKTKTVDDE